MPARRFDAERLLLARRDARLKQSDIGQALGVSGARVSAWETGRSVPDPERLPGLAQALGQDLDVLFPREGWPDLADLRADAGYTQAATRELTGTRTAGPVAAAENGQRRLAEEYEQRLADAYRVSREALRRAQERSFGIEVPEPDESGQEAPVSAGARSEGMTAVPKTFADKITHLLEQLPVRLSDAEIAARGNSRTGQQVLTEELVRGLRTGQVTSASREVGEALAKAFDTTPLMWSEDADVQRIITETLVLKGQIAAIAARGGGEEGLSAELLAFVSREVGKAREEFQGQPGQSVP
ncbi:helix-turn-helix transcriptional regulator [Streptomyces ipomoeae]|jgi:transcriptional regulator with XRE-family HTH domain|uniref:helix-turn-helix domain-containing protein n=1 Tax=Streptomyces ipomoeae TaxID=103232 RepID=UPI0029B7E166|nr:helix-turn-helix transcriptional regulator [Streptomyces ipomoeae]MDX2819926.1 helix-turn-helix transcriptional regulator [Streptomyces ipomoeae]MDX2872628.1 helix-turn-helix transcriptional regulator [Streptomyces ipomoeae]